MREAIAILSLLAALPLGGAQKKAPVKPPPSALDKYVEEALSRSSKAASNEADPGSLWSPAGLLQDLTRDPKATRVDDVVTILVSESATAATTGTTKTARTTSAQNSITALAGVTKATGPLANLLNLGGTQSIDGQGTTTRTTTFVTTLTARVTHVLPNGYLVLEGTKLLGINSEHQLITVRGVVRPQDLNAANSVPSSSLAQLEVQVDGKGVVADSVKRPNFLYRLLLGLMPF
jgi:flagellar L-ring protein precursor FlgH